MVDFQDEEYPDLSVPNCIALWEQELPEAAVTLALSPRGQLAAVGTVEDEILLLDMATGAVKFKLAGHDGGTNAVAFLSGNQLASVGEDGAARVWNIGRQSCTHDLPIDAVEPDRSPSGFTVAHLTVAPDTKSFACAAGKTVVQFTFDPQQGATAPPTRRVFPALPSTVESLRFDKRGNLLASYYGGLTYWDLRRSEDEKQALDMPYSGACLGADASPRGDWFVAGCHDASVHIYHIKRHEDTGVDLEEMECGGYEGKVTLVDFDSEGRYLASAGGERCIVWDFDKSPAGSMPTLTLGHRKSITCQGWQPDGDLLVTGGRDGRLYFYDISFAMPAREGPAMCLPGALADQLGDEVTQLVWGREGRVLAGYLSGFVRLWELPLADSEGEEEEGAEEQQQQQQPDGAGGQA